MPIVKKHGTLGVILGDGVVQKGCCCSVCSGLGGLSPAYGCNWCLCRTATKVFVCISGESGANSALNSGTDPWEATGSAGVYQYLDTNNIKIDVTFDTGGTNGYETTTITSYVWNGASWDLVRTLGPFDASGSLCTYTETIAGPITYIWKAESWQAPTNYSFTFSGIQLVTSGAPCASSTYHVSGTPNASYSMEETGDPSEQMNCLADQAVNDTTCTSTIGGISGGTLYIIISNLFSVDGNQRGYVIYAYGNAGPALTAMYFIGFVDLGDTINCKGTHVCNNLITTACEDTGTAYGLGNYRSIGYNGSCTLVVT